jgi:diadenosine tetraphosphate (Ap4A) HIT family hydrolase
MAIGLPHRNPCPHCENFAGRYSATAGEPPVLLEDAETASYLNPSALGGIPGHALVVPKRHVETIFDPDGAPRLTFTSLALASRLRAHWPV